jgi:hypothetical protein
VQELVTNDELFDAFAAALFDAYKTVVATGAVRSPLPASAGGRGGGGVSRAKASERERFEEMAALVPTPSALAAPQLDTLIRTLQTHDKHSSEKVI